MTAKFENVKQHIGSIVHADRSLLTDKDFVAQCLEKLNDRIVLVFPKINLTDREQLAFTDMLGERVSYTNRIAQDGDPDVYQVTLDPKLNSMTDLVLGTFFWHMDGVLSDIPPPKASLLSARKISLKGGQTEFANSFAAYENLPDDEKEDIEGLRVVHSTYASVRGILPNEVGSDDWDGPKFSKEHPLVWKHKSGKKSLLIGSHAEQVVGMTLPEGRALLARLLEWTAQPDFTYRHKWSEGDFVVWNNCGALHRVTPYNKESGRMMHRTSIAGSEMVQ